MMRISQQLQRKICELQSGLMVRFHQHIVNRYHVAITPDEAAVLWMTHRNGQNPKNFRKKLEKEYQN